MTKKYYKDVVSNPDFAEVESKILQYWDENNIFQKSIDQRNARDEFIFYDGPPFANGLPHYGHLLTGFIKDVYARYHTMKGSRVERRFGWDCHGLPAEMQAEKELGIQGRIAISEFGIDKFNQYCETSVMKYTNEWETYVKRQARWVDFKNSYKTMDLEFMESVLSAFKELYNRGCIYESMRVMPYSYACQTPLSNFETRLDNAYRERADKAVTLSFILNEKPSLAPDHFDEYKILAWTTTPWTLPSNLALAVGKDIDYICIPHEKTCYIIAEWAALQYAKELNYVADENFIKLKGSDLENLTYMPLFDYFKNEKNAFKILIGDFVETGSGTGIVHMAPGFGEDDQILCEKYNINIVCPVDNAGKFTSLVPDFENILVFDANDKIIIKLKEQGSWLKTEQYLHNYPHCWRSDTPLIYKAVPSWYVNITGECLDRRTKTTRESIRDRMCRLNKDINWIPEHIKEGLFGKWIENARDWSISRNRFWGTPIPIWKSNDPKYPRIDVYGSVAELENDFNVKVENLHRPFIDSLERANPNDPTGKSLMVRVEDVFDCWFESGSMPYAQQHFMFDDNYLDKNLNIADFIVEYSAQTRGWFYTLMVLSTALFDNIPFKNCICHGVILDSTGQKLSKRLNNYADPLELFDKYGSDALRVTMLSSTVVQGQELLIDKDGKMIYETLRLFIKPIWNAYNFFIIYANADGIKAEYLDILPTNLKPLDSYILAKLKIATESITSSLDKFDTQTAYSAISSFFEILNNWYIRRSRERFWKSTKDDDKILAYNVLYTSIITMCKYMASLLPLVSESIYLNLNDNEQSVHLGDLYNLNYINIDRALVGNMDIIIDICSSALFIRNNLNIRVRQPIAVLSIIGENFDFVNQFEDLIKDELNIKEIKLISNLDDYATKKLSINFPLVGKRLASSVKNIISASRQNQWTIKNDKLQIADVELELHEYSLTLEPNKNIKAIKSLSSGLGLVILDTEITESLYEEGIARDIIRLIQILRKDSSMEVSDRIYLEICGEEKLKNILSKYQNFIEDQTLSKFTTNLDIYNLYDGRIDIFDLQIRIIKI
jgi:isoleucyl-tRNA synthetase